MGLEKLNNKLQDPDFKDHFTGLFPTDHPKNTRFSINFFTSIGLGILTENLRAAFQNTIKNITNQAVLNQQEEESDSSSDSSSSSDSDSSDSSSSSDSD